MKKNEKEKLAQAGFEKTSVSDFLDLDRGDEIIVELRVALAQALRERRKAKGITQNELAKRQKTSQSRISSLESGDDSVTIDALISALAELDTEREQIIQIMSGSE
jgi:predicted transcriptional regulator